MIPPNDEPVSQEKKLRFVSFAAHAARGLVREHQTRRKTMFAVVLIALVMLFCGATFLAPMLDPQTRPGWFIFYWAVCAWVTMTAVLLAVFDLLLVRAQERAARHALATKFSSPENPEDEA